MTRLDPIREARVRRMVLDPSIWPQRYLCMKRIGVKFEFGIIASDVRPNRIVITDLGHVQIAAFDNIDQLVEAGWAVD
jgi:hypothetical protein